MSRRKRGIEGNAGPGRLLVMLVAATLVLIMVSPVLLTRGAARSG
jgi:hypothetical protein